MGEYRVKFEVFEGPLDLLLHLIRKEEVDIYEVNLTKIATEFIEYLNLMRELDLDVAGEFVVMAATLMLIKSRELLPRDQRPAESQGEDEEGEDPRWELIRQLVEYRKFKDAASRLQEFEHRAENTFVRVPGRVELPESPEPRRGEASLLDLLSAVNVVLQRFHRREGEARDVFEDRWSVSEKIESLITRLRSTQVLRFSELFEAATSRTEVVVTFLAVLELTRLRMIVPTQSEPFAEITLELAPPPAEPSTATGEASPGAPAPAGPAPEANASVAEPPGLPDAAPTFPQPSAAADAADTTGAESQPSADPTPWN